MYLFTDQKHNCNCQMILHSNFLFHGFACIDFIMAFNYLFYLFIQINLSLYFSTIRIKFYFCPYFDQKLNICTKYNEQRYKKHKNKH